MSQPTVTRLKELLFDKEARDLDALAQRVDGLGADLTRRLDRLDERAGGDAQLRTSVSRVIDGAIRDAEETRHRDLADAMAPVVVRTVKSEIAAPHTQDEIAGALYPKIGEMVRKYVASAMHDLMEGINRRLEQGLTQNRLMLKLRSLVTGRSMAELALAETQTFDVDELYLIRRGSGELVHRWQRTTDTVMGTGTGAGAGSNRDALVSGFLTAITAFAEEAFADEKASLRSLDLDEHRIYLRASPAHLLAAKCKGASPGDIEQLLDAELLRVLDDHNRIEGQFTGAEPASRDTARREHARVLGGLAERLESQIKQRTVTAKAERGGLRPLKVLAWVIGLPLLAFLGWQGWLTYSTGRVQAAADRAIAEVKELKGYGIRAQAERGGRTVWLVGVAPSDAVRQALVAKARQELDGISPDVRIATDELNILPAQTDVGAVLRTEFNRTAIARAGQRLRTLATDLKSAAERLGANDAGSDIAASQAVISRAVSGVGNLVPESDDAQLATALAPLLQQLEAAELRLAALAGDAPATAPRDVAPFDRLASHAERISQLTLLIEQGHARARAVAPLEAEIKDLRRRLEGTPREALVAWSRQNAVFFSNGTDYRNNAMASTMLDEAARLITQAGIQVRVVGFTDQAGEQSTTGVSRNLTLSLQRAERVVDELVRRGVPRNRLLAVGRGTSEIGPPPGASNPARRVEVEAAYIGEEASP